MSYSIQWTREATRDIKRLDATLRKRIVRAVEELADHPRPPGCKKLIGYVDTWRIRVGDWRILYRIDDKVLLVMILRVRPRGGAYG